MNVYWNSTLMAINPDRITSEPAAIVEVIVHDNNPETGPQLLIRLRRLRDQKEGVVILMRWSDPDGEWSEELDPDGMAKSIRGLLNDFGVTTPDQLVREKPIEVTGLYFMGSLVGFSKIS